MCVCVFQGGMGFARDLRFESIVMKNVSNPIIIDQYYCDQPTPCANQTRAVEVREVGFADIRGTSDGEGDQHRVQRRRAVPGPGAQERQPDAGGGRRRRPGHRVLLPGVREERRRRCPAVLPRQAHRLLIRSKRRRRLPTQAWLAFAFSSVSSSGRVEEVTEARMHT